MNDTKASGQCLAAAHHVVGVDGPEAGDVELRPDEGGGPRPLVAVRGGAAVIAAQQTVQHAQGVRIPAVSSEAIFIM